MFEVTTSLALFSLAGLAGAPTSTAPSAAVRGEDTATPVTADDSGEHHLTPLELAIWNDPAFKKRFAESYIAETEVEPSVTVLEREQVQEVLDKISADKIDKALALLKKNNSDGASAVFDFLVGNIHFQREELDRAAAAYRIAVKKHPRFRRAWGNLGLIYVRQSDFDRAAEAFTQVISLGGGDAVNYGLLGFTYANLDNHLGAESAYRMAVLLDPETMDWKRGLVQSFFKQRRYAEAAALCRTLIDEHTGKPEFWLIQASAYIGMERPLDAAENYEIVDRLGGSTVASLNNLADIYVSQELFDLAVGAYLRALALDPAAKPDRAIRAAKVLGSRGLHDETAMLIDGIDAARGDALATEDKTALLKLRARIALAQGAGDEEAQILEQIVELNPLDGDALILLGKHARRTGDNEKAAFYFERAANIEDFEADANVAHAQLLVGMQKYNDAVKLLKGAQKIRHRENVQRYLEQVERIAKR